MNNTDLLTGPMSHQLPIRDFQFLKEGGACLFQGEILYVNSTYLKDNCGFLGGAFMIEANLNPQSVYIENSIFEANYAVYGSALGFSLKILNVSTFLRKNYYKSNVGLCNCFVVFNLKKKKLSRRSYSFKISIFSIYFPFRR